MSYFSHLLSLRNTWDVLRFLLFSANGAIASGVIFSTPAFKAMHPIIAFRCCTTSTAIHLKTSHEFIVSCFEWIVKPSFAILRIVPQILFFLRTHIYVYIYIYIYAQSDLSV